MDKISVIILGTGNVANHLIDAFLDSEDVDLIQIYGRNLTTLKNRDSKLNTISNLDYLKDADIYIIAIADDAIAEFSSQLKLQNKLVVHTSGSVAINNLQTSANKGVFYPLQTFSKGIPVDFKQIPICIETEHIDDYLILEKLAYSISDKVYPIDSIQRKYIHLAAVFTNNFVNYMYTVGKNICDENNIPFEILHPLIKETAKKIENNIPENIQTGPAVRNDIKTINTHLNMLNGKQKEIYKLLTTSIKDNYGKKL